MHVFEKVINKRERREYTFSTLGIPSPPFEPQSSSLCAHTEIRFFQNNEPAVVVERLDPRHTTEKLLLCTYLWLSGGVEPKK